MDYDKKLIEKARCQTCDICNRTITTKEAENKEFHYSKTKRKTEIFVHKKCWERLYGGIRG